MAAGGQDQRRRYADVPCRLAAMARVHVVPRAYLRGFADTVHAGMEGRPISINIGRVYLREGPKYFSGHDRPASCSIALSVLALLGLGLFSLVDPPDWNLPASIILGVRNLVSAGAGAGRDLCGNRHALPVLVLLSIFAGFFVERAIVSHSRSLQAIAVIAFALARFRRCR